MTLSQIADLADLIAAFGVIISLLFLVWELRKNGEQARRANWQTIVGGLREHKRRTDDPYVADLIERGRRDYGGLTAAERITFGYWMEEMLQGFDAFLVFGDSNAVAFKETYRATVGAFRYHFGYPGCRQWWIESGLDKRWPRHLVAAVEESMRQNSTEPFSDRADGAAR